MRSSLFQADSEDPVRVRERSAVHPLAPLLYRAALCLSLAVLTGSLSAQNLPSPSTLRTMSVEELMNIEVTSVSMNPEKLLDAASAIQVVTGEDIRRSGATSLPEALRNASNLEVAQIDSRQWAISSRGFNNLFADKLLVLVDGRSVYTPLYAGVYWDVQDTVLEDVDRIEVISGPGATQWGANAMNGVINVTTKSAKDTQGALVVGGTGTDLSQSETLRYGGEIAPKVYYRVYAKYFDRSDSVSPSGQKSSDAWRMGQVGFRIDSDLVATDHMTLQGDAYDGKEGQAGPDSIRTNGDNLLGRWSRALGDGSDVDVQLYRDHTHRRIPGSFTQDVTTYDFDMRQHRSIGERQSVVVGLGYRLIEDSIINTPANAFLPPDVNREVFSGLLQDEIELSKDLIHLTVGTKIEHNDYTGFEIQPSARVAWTPDTSQTVWTAISRAVRTPSRIDRDLYSPATPPYRVAGSNDVVSEKLISGELGYRVQFKASLGVSLSTFYNSYDDLRSLEPLTPPLAFPVVASNGLEGHSSGAELAADWAVSSLWRLKLGYTELRVHSEPQGGSIDRSTRDSIARDPNHQLSLRSLLEVSDHWELDADARYVSAIQYQRLPGYAEAGLRLGWRPTSVWEVSVSGENLLHDHHAEFNNPATRREIPRSAYVKVTCTF